MDTFDDINLTTDVTPFRCGYCLADLSIVVNRDTMVNNEIVLFEVFPEWYVAGDLD